MQKRNCILEAFGNLLNCLDFFIFYLFSVFGEKTLKCQRGAKAACNKEKLTERNQDTEVAKNVCQCYHRLCITLSKWPTHIPWKEQRSASLKKSL